MRVPLRWLGESVDLPDDVTLEHVHAALVSVGFEEEAVHTFDLTGPVVVGRVLERVPEPQKNGKTINWCQVDVGEPEPRGIVCGAHNFDVGDKVVVTLPGAVLPGPFPIAARKTYGHVSDGMIASARELGLGDEHDGILRFADLGMDPDVGADAIALLGLDDAAVEINVTPDRGYAMSLRGVAREYAHATGASFHDPVDRVARAPGRGLRRDHRGRRADPRPRRFEHLRHPRRPWHRRHPSDTGMDGVASVARGRALHLAAGRHHQLRDVRARPAPARLRPRHGRRRARRPSCDGGGDPDDARRRHPASSTPRTSSSPTTRAPSGSPA